MKVCSCLSHQVLLMSFMLIIHVVNGFQVTGHDICPSQTIWWDQTSLSTEPKTTTTTSTTKVPTSSTPKNWQRCNDKVGEYPAEDRLWRIPTSSMSIGTSSTVAATKSLTSEDRYQWRVAPFLMMKDNKEQAKQTQEYTIEERMEWARPNDSSKLLGRDHINVEVIGNPGITSLAGMAHSSDDDEYIQWAMPDTNLLLLD